MRVHAMAALKASNVPQSRRFSRYFPLNCLVTKIWRHKGTFIFYEVGGLMGFEGGGHAKKIWLQRGGQPEKYVV